MFSRASSIRLLIAIIILTCIGLLALQVRLLQNTAELRRATFEQNVMAALASAAQTLEERNIVDRMFFVGDPSVHPRTPAERTSEVRQRSSPDTTMSVSVIVTPAGTLRTWVSGGRLVGSSDRPQRITVEALDDLGRLDTTLLLRQQLTGEFSVPIPQGMRGRTTAYMRIKTDKGVSTMRVDTGKATTAFSFAFGDTVKRDRLVRRVVESFALPAPAPIGASLPAASLDSLVGERLRQQAIDQPFVAAITADDSVVVATDRSGLWPEAAATFRLPVRSMGPFASHEQLVVRFPSWRSHLWTGLWPEISVTAALFAVIVGIFVATLRTIRRQKEFAGRLSDFIGNMTHEFKTPLATISLASEALTRPDVKRSAKKIDTYNGVIRDENRRMGSQVERILQMASLEEGELDLRRERLMMHDLIREVVEHARMTVSHQGGTLDIQFRASDSAVWGDRMHLENVVHNLLDNAVKYSPEAPVLTVTTESDGRLFRFSVKDCGIGIAPDQVERVFEKYYRVPTGNVHDVKGFGLGLSYVKLVVTSLGGQVSLTSAPGEGTEVSVRLPLAGPAGSHNRD